MTLSKRILATSPLLGLILAINGFSFLLYAQIADSIFTSDPVLPSSSATPSQPASHSNADFSEFYSSLPFNDDASISSSSLPTIITDADSHITTSTIAHPTEAIVQESPSSGDSVLVLSSSHTPRIPVPRVTSVSPRFSTEVIPLPMKSGWDPWYGGNMNYSYTDKTLSIMTNGTDFYDWFGAHAPLVRTDMSDYALSLKVKFTDWQNLSFGSLLIATDDGIFADVYAFNFREYFMNPESDEWMELRIDKTDFEVASGDPDWSHATNLVIRVAGGYTRPAGISIKDIKLIPLAQEPIITLAFDDGLDDVIDTAFPIMQNYGFVGTNYVIPYLLSSEGYQTFDDLHRLHDAGWDISGHSVYNLRTLSQKDLTTEMDRIGVFFSTYPFTGSQNFAYPNGSYNARIVQSVSKHFATARNIDGLTQPLASIASYNINAKTVSQTTTIEEIKQWIDDAKKDRSWLILVWHALPEVANDDIEYPKEGFMTILHYIKDSGVAVLPASRVLGN